MRLFPSGMCPRQIVTGGPVPGTDLFGPLDGNDVFNHRVERFVHCQILVVESVELGVEETSSFGSVVKWILWVLIGLGLG